MNDWLATHLPAREAIDAERRRRESVRRLAACAALCSNGLWLREVPHLELLAEWLEDAARGQRRRLIVEIPVRHGKSTIISHYFPVWFLEQWPTKQIVLTGHNAEFAASWGRRVRNTIDEHSGPEGALRVALASDSTAAHRWHTADGGGMTTYGVGNPPVGRGADLLIVDDPIQSYEEAYSEVQREKLWNWWATDIYTRLEPGAAVVVTMARWHQDDLVGRLKQRMADGFEHWDVLRLPAIAEGGDLLGRAHGEPLWPTRWDLAALDHIRDRGTTPAGWAALYQQRPEPAGSGIFRRDTFRYYAQDDDRYVLRQPDGTSRHVQASAGYRFATVDLAASMKTSGDYTAVSCVQVLPDHTKLLLEQVRVRCEGPDQVPLIASLIAKWGLGYVAVERIGYQLSMIQQARRAGLPVSEINVDKDKVSRALTLAKQLEDGQWYWRAGAPWLEVFEAELLAFPNGTHDDQVDSAAYAAIGAEQRVVWEPKRMRHMDW